jgi:hypothetical protein
MKRSALVLSCVLAAVVASGCATTRVTPDGTAARAGRIAKPGRIIVYPFAATTADLAPDVQGSYVDGATSAQNARIGRELGIKVADYLVEEINEMKVPAEVGSAATQPRIGDIVIRGHFESIEQGNSARRWVVGFGSGKAELRTVVAAYQMTNYGLKRIGGGTVDTAGGKGPGLFVPVIVTAATANPVGLIVAGAAKVEGEASGRTTIDGAAERTADKIAERIEQRMEDEGWITD